MKGMLITALILLALSRNVIDGLSCIREDLIEISLDELTHEKFQEEMDDIGSSDNDDITECGVTITVDYTANELTIEFDAGISTAKNGEINAIATLYTTFSRIPEQKHVSELYITCSSEDNCDENFLTMDDHYQWWWLIDEVNHMEIEQMLKKFFIEDESTPSTVRCYDNSTIIPCSTKACVLRTIDELEPHQVCPPFKQNKLHLIIQTKLMIKSPTNQLIHAIDYTCQFDLCNDQLILLQANNITNMYYNVSPMLRIFTRKPIIELSTTSIITHPSSISTSIKPSSTASPTQSSTTASPTQSSTTTNPTQSSSIASPTQSSSTTNPFKSSPIESSSTSALTQSTTEINSAGDRLKVSIKLISLIFQICALLFL